MKIFTYDRVTIHHKTSLLLIIASGNIKSMPSPFIEVKLTPCNIWEAQSHLSCYSWRYGTKAATNLWLLNGVTKVQGFSNSLEYCDLGPMKMFASIWWDIFLKKRILQCCNSYLNFLWYNWMVANDVLLLWLLYKRGPSKCCCWIWFHDWNNQL